MRTYVPFVAVIMCRTCRSVSIAFHVVAQSLRTNVNVFAFHMGAQSPGVRLRSSLVQIHTYARTYVNYLEFVFVCTLGSLLLIL